MFEVNLTVLSYHRFGEEESDYPFSRTYDQFWHDIRKKQYDWITIDDGHASIVKACEMMQAINIRAKLFISTGLVGTAGYCTWEQLKVLSQCHDIENHSHTHLKHSKMPHDTIYTSMVTANDLIKTHIGRTPRYFVPPYNDFDERVSEIASDLELVLVKDRINILNTSK